MRVIIIVAAALMLLACSWDSDFQRIDPHTPFWGASQSGIKDDDSEEVYLLKGADQILGTDGYMAVEISRSADGSVGKRYRMWLESLEDGAATGEHITGAGGKKMIIVPFPSSDTTILAFSDEAGVDKRRFFLCSDMPGYDYCTVIFRFRQFYGAYIIPRNLLPKDNELNRIICEHLQRL